MLTDGNECKLIKITKAREVMFHILLQNQVVVLKELVSLQSKEHAASCFIRRYTHLWSWCSQENVWFDTTAHYKNLHFKLI